MRRYRLVSLLICSFIMLAATSGSARTSSPDAVSLTVSNPYCTQASPISPTCLIYIRSISATSTDPNFRGVQISINGKARAFFSEFFENSVVINDSMMGKGLQVICGGPNASGVPGSGLQYGVEISALITGSSPITDTANVTCPFFESKLYLPMIKR